MLITKHAKCTYLSYGSKVRGSRPVVVYSKGAKSVNAISLCLLSRLSALTICQSACMGKQRLSPVCTKHCLALLKCQTAARTPAATIMITAQEANLMWQWDGTAERQSSDGECAAIPHRHNCSNKQLAIKQPGRNEVGLTENGSRGAMQMVANGW